MKRRTILIWVITLLLLVTATGASAKVQRDPFTGTMILEEYLYPGDWSYPGDNTHVRNMVELMRAESDDARVTGWNTVVANGNWDAEGYGPVWGTNHLAVDELDGYWEGTFMGSIDENGLNLRMRGRGYGAVAGLMIEGTNINGITEGVIRDIPGR